MKKILRGVRHFHENVFPAKRELFESLAQSQKPDALFITCSDSRVHPNLITNTEPGELFILRNPGNVIPPYQAGTGSEAATIEYAIEVLKINDIIVCGHSNCGAVSALLTEHAVRDLPAVANWLNHAEGTRRIIEAHHGDVPFEERLELAVNKNVLFQVDNLKTHPSVAANLGAGNLKIHAWVYDIGTGGVQQYDWARGKFEPLFDDAQLKRRMLEAAV